MNTHTFTTSSTEPAHAARLVPSHGWGDASAAPAVEVVVPVYNEERSLESSVRRLCSFLALEFPFSYTITVADNASSDRTWEIAQRLAAELGPVNALHLEERGRGRALRRAWSQSEASVVAYMDVDLSTGLEALLPLVAPLLSGHSDVAIGSRLLRGSKVRRGLRRELISRIYNQIVRLVLRTRFSDAQCGFKAVRAERVGLLLDAVADQGWFFDTELLVVSERAGLRIHEVPVDWVDDPDSRVRVVSTAFADLRGVWRLRCTRPRLSPNAHSASPPRPPRSARPARASEGRRHDRRAA
jgi:glycosyltransferase involved in cell wall biosynthesis